MIFKVEITQPPLGPGYLIVDASTRVTDESGTVVPATEYYVTEQFPQPPVWYVEEVVTPFVLPPETPQSVTMRQARLALLDSGLLSTVEAALDSLPEPQRTRSLIEWNHGTTVERSSALVVQMANALGLTDNQIDDLFIQANTY